VESKPAATAFTVFIIRVWFERASDRDSRRGYVEHVPSGNRRYFRDIEEVADFIAVLSVAVPDTTA
jgi:hypothetical protein